MRIEALEDIKHHPYYLDKGDIKNNMDDDVGQMMWENGWVKDLDRDEVNERSDKPVTLDIQNSVLGLTDNME